MTPVAAFLRFFIAGILQALFFQHLVLANGWLTPSIHVYGLAMLPLGRKPWVYLVAGIPFLVLVTIRFTQGQWIS